MTALSNETIQIIKNIPPHPKSSDLTDLSVFPSTWMVENEGKDFEDPHLTDLQNYWWAFFSNVSK